jgi:uncharacterized OsmC-like protein
MYVLKADFLGLTDAQKRTFRDWVNEQLAERPMSAPAPTTQTTKTPVQTKTPADKMPKILAALAAAGTVGLTVGELYSKAGAYLTDLDAAVKQGVIREEGEKYFEGENRL